MIAAQTSGDVSSPGYSIINSEEIVARAADYLERLRLGRTQPGGYLCDRLEGVNVQALTELDLLSKLIDTKPPQIFAETAVSGDGSDWNLTELGLLGDISIAVPVTVFDDGNHFSPTLHVPPFSGMLIFTPGALLRNGRGNTSADWNEVTTALRLLDRARPRLRAVRRPVPGSTWHPIAGCPTEILD